MLHNGSDHWLTISTIGAWQDEVFIFDSLYCSVSQSVKNQIAAILATTSKRIQLNFVSVQKQSGGCDCGLFTLAFATTLVSGHNPGHYVFDQRKMRKHLYKCLDKGHMEMFPHKEVQSHSKIASIDYICVCRMPEINGVDMVECCKCAEWYHLSCVDVPKQILEDSCLDWFCPSCL